MTSSGTMTREQIYIAGKWQRPGDTDWVDLVDPSTEEVFTRAPLADDAAVDAAVSAARLAFDRGPWPRLTRDERMAVLLKLASFLEKHSAEYGQQVVSEIGLPLPFARGGVINAARQARYVAEVYSSYPWQEGRRGVTGIDTVIERVPVGVVAAIVPWNSSFSLSASKLFPALLAGCTMILKASPLNALSALGFADAAEYAGLPEGVLSVFAAAAGPSDHLVRHPGVDKIAFTGSDAVGRSIAAAAAPSFKRVTLELGGKSGGIVLPDTSLERLTQAVPPSFTLNNGEACAAMTRLIVPESRAEEIVTAVAAEVAKIPVGDPRDPHTAVGPIVTKAQFDRILALIGSAVQDGGRIVVGGQRPEYLERGYYIAPTIIDHVAPESRIAQEEVFGPVLTALTYPDSDIDRAVEIANGTNYGLSAAVFGEDDGQVRAVAERLRSGSVHLNNGFTVDIGIPFGGFKCSGLGREFGPEGIDPYVESRAIFLNGRPYVTKGT